MTKGGKRPGAGRPVGTNKANKAQTHSIRLTDTDYNNFKLLGGVKWLREAIKEAMKNIIQ
ncbi:MAG: hypothetical protein LUH05_04030 [Candidatus Gastranaerophilales bacterium]|nr:hypothetical protein [Candidatus Gastranaerophilales bacterium]